MQFLLMSFNGSPLNGNQCTLLEQVAFLIEFVIIILRGCLGVTLYISIYVSGLFRLRNPFRGAIRAAIDDLNRSGQVTGVFITDWCDDDTNISFC